MKRCLGVFLAAASVLAALLPVRANPGFDAKSIIDGSHAGVFASTPSSSDIQAPPVLPGTPAADAPKAGTTARPIGNGRVTPDWSFTPGRLCTATDPDFKEFRYPEHIPYCNRDVTQQMKQEVAAHYGIPQSEWPNYEFDHLIPLCLGGDSHVDNLWPQPHGNPDGSDGKDQLENQLFKEISAGTITQAEAVRQIYAWFGVSPQIPVPARPAVR